MLGRTWKDLETYGRAYEGKSMHLKMGNNKRWVWKNVDICGIEKKHESINGTNLRSIHATLLKK